MTLSQIKKEINALKRQYAVPLAVVRIRRLAHDFCNQWETAREEGKPTMHPIQSAQWFIQRGIPPGSFNGLFDYVRRCAKEKELPLTIDVVRAILPWKASKRIIDRVFRRGEFLERRPGYNGPISHRDLQPAFPIMSWPRQPLA